MNLTIIETAHGLTCVKGVSQCYFQNGIPVGLTVDELDKWPHKVHVSQLNLADQFQKAGWGDDKIIALLKEEYRFTRVEFQEQLVRDFLNKDYDAQREMIFQYLWKGDPKAAVIHLLNKLNPEE
jgi:hypothetical protein